MAPKLKQIRFEKNGFEDSSDSRASSPTPSVSSFYRGPRPEKGTTRIPARVVSKRALIALGYPFAEDGDTIIVQLALGPDLIEELLKLSESIRNSGQGTSEFGDAWRPEYQGRDRGFDWINVDAPGSESPGPPSAYEGRDDDLESALREEEELGDFDGPVVHSGVLTLDNTTYFTDSIADPTLGRLMAWQQESSDFMSGAVTQLYAVHAAEFYMDRAGNQKVTLVCPKDDGHRMDEPSLVRMRWLHVKAESLNITTLETLVSDCPFLTQPLRSVAVAVVKEVAARCARSSETGHYIDSGAMIQYIGRYNSSLGRYPDEDISDTEPVSFISAPYPLLADRSSGRRYHGNHYMRSLREVLYGYDDGTPHDVSNGAQSVHIDGSGPLSVQVPQIWTLVIGSDLIITHSELPASDIQHDLIMISATSSPAGTYTIKLIDEKEMCRYHLVISPDCKYVDFFRHAVALALKGQSQPDITAYVLVDEYGVTVTPDTWLTLLAEGIIEDFVFGLRERNMENRTPTDEFRALSERLLPTGSRSSLGRYSRRSSFRSEFRDSELNMQLVLHPGMWEYGADLPNLPSGDAETTRDDDLNYDDDGIETSTLLFESHLGDEDSSLDGTIDLTTSVSNISSGPREADTFGSQEQPGFAKVPKLFRLENKAETEVRQNEMRRSSDSRREAFLFNNTQERRLTMPLRRMTRSTSFGTEASYPATDSDSRRSEQPRNSSQSSTLKYAQDSPLDPEYLASRPYSRGSFERTTSYTGSQKKPRTESIAGRSIYSTGQFSTSLPPPNLTGMNFIPFLAWRVTWNDDKRSRSEIEKTLTQLLDNLNNSLDVDKIGKWYRASFECSESEAIERFDRIIRHNVQDNLERNYSSRLGRPEPPSLDDNGSFSEPRPEGSCDSFGQDEGSLRFRDRNLETSVSVLSDILRNSKNIISAFLPTNGGLVSHPLCRRFWGTVDSILRALRWLIEMSDEEEEKLCFVLRPASGTIPPEGSPRENDASVPQQCQECNDEKEYQSPDDALDHWHEHHAKIACPRRAKQGRPFDDPCFVWVYQKIANTNAESRLTTPRASAISNSLDFQFELQDIAARAEELHKLVTSVTGLDDPLNYNDNRPHLPSSLVEAFERIVSLFVLKAKEFSWMNKLTLNSYPTRGWHAQRRLEHLRRTGEATSEEIRGFLNRAKEDIMLLGTSKRDMDTIIIAPIGPEFLAALVISNLQNNIIIPGTNQKFDLISHYRNHTEKLRFDTNRRPKRKAFVGIHALEEELEALQMVVASQQNLWRAYQKLFSPLSFKYPTTDSFYYKERKSMFQLERKCVRKQQRRLAERDRALWILRQRTRALRDETKQRIEILDEGHGKAIRVFTIVTLFFLPLSFVTSFFGMNTTDIRDTDYNQRIFWFTAMPVTFGVIGLAFMYGYKWDLVRAWLSRTLKSNERNTVAYAPSQVEKLSWMATMNQKDSSLPRHENPSVSGWRERMSLHSEQRWRRKSKIPRKKTDDSLFR